MTYSATKFEVATSKGLGGDTFTRNVQMDGRRTNFDKKLIIFKNYALFSKEKSGYNNLDVIVND